MQSLYLEFIQEHVDLFAKLNCFEQSINGIVKTLTECISREKKIMLCGNGGSAADSQHIAAELIGRFRKDRPALAALALSTDTSVLTAIGNDYSFADIFSRQINGLGCKGDCLISISTSGNSENIVRAVHAAKARNIHTIGLLGKNGGKLAGICDHSITIPHNDTARIQEAHIFLGHTICALIEKSLNLY